MHSALAQHNKACPNWAWSEFHYLADRGLDVLDLSRCYTDTSNNRQLSQWAATEGEPRHLSRYQTTWAVMARPLY